MKHEEKNCMSDTGNFNVRLTGCKYNTYKRAYEPVSGFGFNRIKFEIVYDNDSEPEKYIRYFCRRNYKT